MKMYYDQSPSTPSAGPSAPSTPADRHDAGNSTEPGGRRYCLTLPPGGYSAEDDESRGLIHVHRLDPGGHGTVHVCSLPAGEYEIDRDDAGVHLFKMPDRENVRLRLSEDACEPEERRGEEDLAMGHSLLPRPAGAGRGRDDGPTEYQRLAAYRAYLKQHYDGYRTWIRERSA
jgi:hypothetical protein